MAKPESSYITWSLVKTILCPPDATPSQREDARKGCQWLTDHIHLVGPVITDEEAEVLGLIYNHWRAFTESPTFEIISLAADTVGAESKKRTSLDEYASAAEEVERHSLHDLPALLALRTKEWRDEKIVARLRACTQIASPTGLELGKGEKMVHLQGAEAALNHFLKRLDFDAMQGGSRPTRCSSGPRDGAFGEMWDAALADDDRDMIATGLTTIDTNIPLRKGQLVGLLGHAGQGKSTLARTITYNAALAGASVLVMPLELEIGEEVIALAIIHACRKFPEEARRLGVTKAAQYQRRLSPEAKQWLSGPVKADFRATFDGRDGRGIIPVARPPELTLDAVIATIERENARHGLDMVTIDYPRCLRLPGKNPRQESEDMISQLKDLAAHFSDGRRLLVLCPIQSNRAGWDQAKKNGGEWEMSAVLEDSAYERYADLIVGVYRDDNLNDEGKVMLSTPKVRNGAPIPPWKVSVDRAAQFFMDGSPSPEFDINFTLDCLEII